MSPGATARKPGVRPGFRVCFTIGLLLQVELLSGPGTQNSPDLAAVDRTLV